MALGQWLSSTDRLRVNKMLDDFGCTEMSCPREFNSSGCFGPHIACDDGTLVDFKINGAQLSGRGFISAILGMFPSLTRMYDGSPRIGIFPRVC